VYLLKTTKISVETLFQRVDPDAVKTTLENGRLEITFAKAEKGLMWQWLIAGDEEAEVKDPQLAQEIHQKLAHLCNEPTTNGGDSELPLQVVSSLNELEECDMPPEDPTFLIAVDPQGNITHTANVGEQWLFNVRVSPDECPSFCIRQDDDGNVWKPHKGTKKDDKHWCTHVNSMPGIGYIHASKGAKYATCSPDYKFAAICKEKRHVYLYQPECPVETELKNRTTGRRYSAVGRCNAISVDHQEDILGIYLSNSVLFILSNTSLHAYLLQ